MNKVRADALKKGFTLVELLVVVAIIAILSAIALVVYGEIQKGVRDTRRKQDLKSIQTALEIYYQKNGRYPCTSAQSGADADYTLAWDFSDKGSDSPWIADDAGCGVMPLGADYIDSMPKDPKNTTSSRGPWETDEHEYAYWAAGTDDNAGPCPDNPGQYYVLIAKLERYSDPEINADRALYCDGKPIISFNSISGGDVDKLYIMTSQD